MGTMGLFILGRLDRHQAYAPKYRLWRPNSISHVVTYLNDTGGKLKATRVLRQGRTRAVRITFGRFEPEIFGLHRAMVSSQPRDKQRWRQRQNPKRRMHYRLERRTMGSIRPSKCRSMCSGSEWRRIPISDHGFGRRIEEIHQACTRFGVVANVWIP